MARLLSRRLVVRAFVEGLAKPDVQLAEWTRSLAAYLIETRQTKQLDLYVADIAKELSAYGQATAQVISARDLNASAIAAITALVAEQTGAKHVALEPHRDERLIGGIQLSFNGRELDTSVRTKLNQLQA